MAVAVLVLSRYLGGTRLGAHLYNLAHSTALPAALAGLGWRQGRPLVLALGLVWLAHLRADRLLGYGLKYEDNFQHTHLGQLGSPEPHHETRPISTGRPVSPARHAFGLRGQGTDRPPGITAHPGRLSRKR